MSLYKDEPCFQNKNFLCNIHELIWILINAQSSKHERLHIICLKYSYDGVFIINAELVTIDTDINRFIRSIFNVILDVFKICSSFKCHLLIIDPYLFKSTAWSHV